MYVGVCVPKVIPIPLNVMLKCCYVHFLESASDTAAGKELTRLKKQYQQILEENNLLKYKVDILLDMVRKNCLKFS